MPTCNLVETIHNKWLQASGNHGSDLYVATVDDFVQRFLQVVNYYQFLKDDVGGTRPSKKELKLRMAERRAQRAVTKKKCIERIVRGANCTAVPTYTGVWTNIRRNTSERT